MNQLLKRAMDAVERLPDHEQAEIARMMLYLAGESDTPEDIEAANLDDVIEALSQAKRGEFATEAEVEAVFRRFGR